MHTLTPPVGLVGLARPELAELSSYVPADPPGIRVRLDANEAPALRSSVIHDVVARAIARVCIERYPDPTATELKSRIAERTGARGDELVVGNGSDELISLVLTALARPREGSDRAAVLVPTPTFVMYAITARTHGLRVCEVPLDAHWDLDFPLMQRAIEDMAPNVVFIASPNNPTGNRMSDDRLEAVIRSAPRSLVIVDEAYVDYGGSSLRTWRRRFPNLAVLRTLSKIRACIPESRVAGGRRGTCSRNRQGSPTVQPERCEPGGGGCGSRGGLG